MSYGMSSPTSTGPVKSGAGKTGNKIPSGYKASQIQQFTPEQMELFKQAFSHLGPDSYTGRLAQGEEGIFNDIEAPAFQQFNELQGQMASRFSGMGTGGRKSSGFQNTANAGAANFAQGLQSQRQGLQRQAIQDLMGMSNTLLNQRPYDQQLFEKPKPWWQEMASGFAGGAGQSVGNWATGLLPWGN
jgi:hypothetical protein